MSKYSSQAEFETVNVFGMGQLNEKYSKYFNKKSFVNPLTAKDAGGVYLANVSFQPGCRNNWHIHQATTGGGQILICTAGEGWYQQEGEPAIRLVEGMVITIPANVKHWHGAAKDSWFSHIAIELKGENSHTQWCEPLTDGEYDAL
ncbi:MAG: cupin domain-containing protein [Erysipelotrichaceae bacterium]